MNEDDDIVPFKMNDIYGGFADAYGIIRRDLNDLIIEIETNWLGFVKSGVKVFRFNLDSVNKIDFKKGYFKGKIIITFNKLKLIEGFPGRKEGWLELRIKKLHFSEARSLVAYVNLWLAEKKLDNLTRDCLDD